MGVIAPKDRKEWLQAFDLAKEFGLSYITAEPEDNQWNYVDSMAGIYGIKWPFTIIPNQIIIGVPTQYSQPSRVIPILVPAPMLVIGHATV